ncbi:evolutionarily conserved C-terminal region 5 [Forsythia ovata]|uniref:YTH domain-containing family protein n=1 Tax=Forsythia ovata TaxID=205694 RepID=A0ABD1PEV3_9LAMI
MATVQLQASDREIPCPSDSTKSPSAIVMEAEETPAEPDSMKEHLVSTGAAIPHSEQAVSQSRSFGSDGDLSVYPSNLYAPQARTIYHKGYENFQGGWEEFPQYRNTEGQNTGSPGIYNDNPSLVSHNGYGYNLQMPYGPYAPISTSLHAVGGDSPIYSPQQYAYSRQPYYQQVVSPSLPYITPSSPVSPADSFVNVDQLVDGRLHGPGMGYTSSLGSSGRGNYSGNPGGVGFQDLWQGFDAYRTGGLWADWPKSSDRPRPLTPVSLSASTQANGSFGSFGQNIGTASQQPRSFYGFGSGSDSCNNSCYLRGLNQGSNIGHTPYNLGTNNRAWLALDNGRRRGRSNSTLCSCSGTIDIFNEQNRGPRALKSKCQIANENYLPTDANERTSTMAKMHGMSYNSQDFVIEYKDAKFFVIKSYSEDNVHKSIKYGVWASTPNGNRKLEVAYREAKEKQTICPVFLFFSVNASAQFCGVAEMAGPVDFEKSVDYWQQDKWSGQFPVKWHIIKDVPNSQFRHIVLESNDNKPVTNSRDTQEVKLEQGIEMLNIFKKYETDVSILDDFDFYEDRQKAMQERKAREQANLLNIGVVGGNENRSLVALPDEIIKQMTKSYAQIVKLDDCSKNSLVTEKSVPVLDGYVGVRVEGEGTATTTVSSAQSS